MRKRQGTAADQPSAQPSAAKRSRELEAGASIWKTMERLNKTTEDALLDAEGNMIHSTAELAALGHLLEIASQGTYDELSADDWYAIGRRVVDLAKQAESAGSDLAKLARCRADGGDHAARNV